MDDALTHLGSTAVSCAAKNRPQEAGDSRVEARSRVIVEPTRAILVADEVDLAVIGGSCTGVFAARLGLRVAIIEALNQFGGTATSRMVYVWHSLLDLTGERQIIGGLTLEVMERLRRREVVHVNDGRDPAWQFRLNPAELACEIDLLVTEHPSIRPFLCARMVAGVCDERQRLTHIVIEDKSGRRAITARQFVDATGDADVLRRMGIAVRVPQECQPPTMAAIISGIEAIRRQQPDFDIRKVIFDPTRIGALSPGFVWGDTLPGLPALTALYGTRVHGVNCADADDLTRAEMEGRGQVRRIIELVRAQQGKADAVHMVALPAAIGIRETVHANCRYRLTEADVLEGASFDDRIGVGTYRVDIHHQGGGGVAMRYLDGREVLHYADGRRESGRWRPERASNPPYYQIPFGCLIPAEGPPNLLLAGRHIDADAGAFGAIRVMVNCNQMGEAAGVAAALGQQQTRDLTAVAPNAIQTHLRAGGSLLP